MRQFGYLVVEGQHDVEFVARLLKSAGLSRVRHQSTLESFWYPIIPKTFPINDDLLKRVPIPTFLQSDTLSIAIHSATGVTRLIDTLQETLSVIDASQMAGLGLMLDSDDPNQTSMALYTRVQAELAKRAFSFQTPTLPGAVVGTNPSFGIYILPDNSTPGTLEDILLQCAELNYSALFGAAKDYIQEVDRTLFSASDLLEYRKPAGKKKAQIGSIASILRPGKAIQVSIQDNRWLEGDAIKIPQVASIVEFLQQLFLG